MIAFLDTSSLIKRYVLEKESERLMHYLERLTGVVVSPVTLIELYSGLMRRLNDRSLSLSDFQWVEQEMLRNFQHFSVVHWSDELVMVAITLIRRHRLGTLDVIQLAGAKLAGVEQLVTSDRALARAARKEVKKVVFI